MARWLKICMDIKEIDWKIMYDNFDSRNGFQTIVFGLDYHEECELLKQLSQALSFDLSFIKYAEGKAFEGSFNGEAVTIDEFIDFFRRLLIHLKEQPTYYKQINYRYINMNYFAEDKFNEDLEVVISFFEHHKNLGATKAWFEFKI